MKLTGMRSGSERPLAIGDVVEVRSEEDILAGLDERGELNGLPFMPEMLQFCGRRFVVDKIAHKTCDTVNSQGIQRMEDTVHLAGLRCDGSAHGGCQAGCLIFWRTEWLKPVRQVAGAEGLPGSPCSNGANEITALLGTNGPASPNGTNGVATANGAARGAGSCVGCSRERLIEVALGAYQERPADLPAEEPLYACQATELPRAYAGRISIWNPRQYVEDVRSGNAPVRKVVRGMLVGLFNQMQDLSSRKLPERYRIKGGLRYPFMQGTAITSPVATLNLQPGEWVRVKSAEEISATLGPTSRNRGLYFDREMLKYCGRTAKVLRRVDHIINESTGQMINMKTPCVILEDVTCAADFHRSCPRAIYSYWREIWLERVPTPTRVRQPERVEQ